MKVEVDHQRQLQRGGPVEIGNVYANQHHQNFRVVLNVIGRDRFDKPWNNVVCICVNALGEIVGAKVDPEPYIRDHQDFVGKVKDMPNLKIEWLVP